MVGNLSRETQVTLATRYVSSTLAGPLFKTNPVDFIFMKSKVLFRRLKTDASFPRARPSSWGNNVTFQKAKEKVSCLKAVDITERAVKIEQGIHGLITADEEQKQFLFRCVQENSLLYPDCKKETLKRKYPHAQ